MQLARPRNGLISANSCILKEYLGHLEKTWLLEQVTMLSLRLSKTGRMKFLSTTPATLRLHTSRKWCGKRRPKSVVRLRHVAVFSMPALDRPNFMCASIPRRVMLRASLVKTSRSEAVTPIHFCLSRWFCSFDIFCLPNFSKSQSFASGMGRLGV